MRRRNVWFALAGVLLAGIVWAMVASRRNESIPPVARAKSSSASAMSGMSGMDMANNGSAKLTAGQIRQFGVTFGTVDVRRLVTTARTTGIVAIDETRLVQVAPKFGGFVERLHANATGQPVRRGQALLDVFSPDLLAAQHELLLASQLQRELGRGAVPGVPGTGNDLVAAAKRRLRLWDVTEAQIDEVIRTGQPRRTLTLYAPAGGVVIGKQVVDGQSIMSGQPLYTIADLSAVWIDIQLREADAAAVRTGTAADIQITGLVGHPLKGRVAYVHPTPGSTSQRIRARVEVANTGGLFKPGMYATVQLITPTRTALTVPNSAVLRTGERNVVFVDMGGGSLMPHHVAPAALTPTPT